MQQHIEQMSCKEANEVSKASVGAQLVMGDPAPDFNTTGVFAYNHKKRKRRVSTYIQQIGGLDLQQ